MGVDSPAYTLWLILSSLAIVATLSVGITAFCHVAFRFLPWCWHRYNNQRWLIWTDRNTLRLSTGYDAEKLFHLNFIKNRHGATAPPMPTYGGWVGPAYASAVQAAMEHEMRVLHADLARSVQIADDADRIIRVTTPGGNVLGGKGFDNRPETDVYRRIQFNRDEYEGNWNPDWVADMGIDTSKPLYERHVETRRRLYDWASDVIFAEDVL